MIHDWQKQLDSLKRQLGLRFESDLARELGVSQQMLDAVRKGKKEITTKMKLALIRKTGFITDRLEIVMALLNKDALAALEEWDEEVREGVAREDWMKRLDQFKSRLALRSESAVARRLGVSPQMLDSVRQGRREISAKMKLALIDELGFIAERHEIIAAILPRDGAAALKEWDSRHGYGANVTTSPSQRASRAKQ